MKILLKTYKSAFDTPGGGEKIMFKIKEYLNKKGHQCLIENIDNGEGFNYDLIHHFSTIDYQNFSYKGKKSILTPTLWPRSSKYYIFKYKFKELIKRHIKKDYISLIDWFTSFSYILPTTELEKERIKTHYNVPATTMKVLNNGVDLPSKNEDRNLFFEKFNIKDYFLFVGNVSKVKNILPLINVCNKTKDKLVIIGEAKGDLESGEYFEKCKELAADNIYFLGQVNDEGLLASCYLNAKACVIPSFFETCSLVAMEAGSRGVPVIITSSGGTTEIFKNKVTYIDPFDQNSLEQALVNFNNSKDIKKYILENYSWDRIIDRLIEIYSDVLKK